MQGKGSEERRNSSYPATPGPEVPDTCGWGCQLIQSLAATVSSKEMGLGLHSSTGALGEPRATLAGKGLQSAEPVCSACS